MYGRRQATSPGLAPVLMPLLILLAGCATRNPAPRGWLPTSDHAAQDAFGAWAVVELQPGLAPTLPNDSAGAQAAAQPSSGRVAFTWEGELIAVDRDTIFLLAWDRLQAIPTSTVRVLELWAYDIEVSGLGYWTLFGTIGTVSHGWWLIFTLPIWATTGSLLHRSASREPRHQYKRNPWPDAAAYARFPQGLGPEIDRTALRPRHVAPVMRAR